MNISQGKIDLANLIKDGGGWCSGPEYTQAAQDGDGCINFYTAELLNFCDIEYAWGFIMNGAKYKHHSRCPTIDDFSTTCLSKEEYDIIVGDIEMTIDELLAEHTAMKNEIARLRAILDTECKKAAILHNKIFYRLQSHGITVTK